MERSVLEKIKNIQDIPTLPAVAIEVMGLAKKPDVSIKDISECIHKDPPLAMKVLRMANSIFYRRGSQEIDTLHRAILMMGLNEVINITTSVSVLSLLSPADRKGETHRAAFWNHCVATGLIAKHIDRKIGMRSQGREFVGGLLHDIGKIIFDEFFHDDYEKACDLAASTNRPEYETEAELIGATHMEVGHFLAQKWGLPPYLADVTLNHHHPSRAQFKDVAALVSVADLLAKAKELSCHGDAAPFVLNEQEGWITLKKIGFPMDDLDIERITFEIEDVGEEVKSYISTVADEPGEVAANG